MSSTRIRVGATAALMLPLVLTDGSQSTLTTASSGFERVEDETGTISVDVPEDWVDRNTERDDDDRPRIAAAEDIAGFLETYDVSGVRYVAIPYDDDVDGLIDSLGDPSGCSSPVEAPFDNGVLVGTSRTMTCGEDCHATLVLVFANPDEQSFTAQVDVQAATDEELGDTAVVLDTLGVGDGDEATRDETTVASTPADISEAVITWPSDAGQLTLPADLSKVVADVRISADCP